MTPSTTLEDTSSPLQRRVATLTAMLLDTQDLLDNNLEYADAASVEDAKIQSEAIKDILTSVE